MRLFCLVASTGIEPVSGASETLILSIVLRGQMIADFRFQIADLECKNRHSAIANLKSFDQSMGIGGKDLNGNGEQNYAKKLSHRN